MIRKKLGTKTLANLDNVTAKSAFFRMLSVGATVSGQLLVPFVFLRYSTLEDLGLWYVIISVGSFASLLDLGLIQVMVTSAIQKLNSSRRESFEILNSLFNYLLIVITATIFIFILSSVYFKEFSPFTNVDFLVLSSLYFLNVALGLLLRFFEGCFRVLGSVTGLQIMVFQSYADLIILSLNLIENSSLLNVIIEILVLKFFLLGVLCVKFQIHSQALSIVNPVIVLRRIKEYFRLGVSYLGMPVGYLVVNEISNLSIAALLGLENLGVYSILKSISGVFRQITGIFTLSLQPRITELLARKERASAMNSFIAVRRRLIITNIGALLLLLVLYKLIEDSFSNLQSTSFLVYGVFLLCAFMDIWWLIDSMVINAANAHEGMTFRFLGGATMAGLIGFVLVPFIGVSGMAIATLVIDLLMIPYCRGVRRQILSV
jgi:O-antigen/teichoic acid export membrane protein